MFLVNSSIESVGEHYMERTTRQKVHRVALARHEHRAESDVKTPEDALRPPSASRVRCWRRLQRRGRPPECPSLRPERQWPTPAFEARRAYRETACREFP